MAPGLDSYACNFLDPYVRTSLRPHVPTSVESWASACSLQPAACSPQPVMMANDDGRTPRPARQWRWTDLRTPCAIAPEYKQSTMFASLTIKSPLARYELCVKFARIGQGEESPRASFAPSFGHILAGIAVFATQKRARWRTRCFAPAVDSCACRPDVTENSLRCPVAAPVWKTPTTQEPAHSNHVLANLPGQSRPRSLPVVAPPSPPRAPPGPLSLPWPALCRPSPIPRPSS